MAKTASQFNAEIAQALRAKKWQRGIDRHETCAQVHPTWEPARDTGIGLPDYWIVVVSDKRARAETAAEGKKLALAMLKDVPSP